MEQPPRKRGRPKLFLTKEMVEERRQLKRICKNSRRSLQGACNLEKKSMFQHFWKLISVCNKNIFCSCCIEPESTYKLSARKYLCSRLQNSFYIRAQSNYKHDASSKIYLQLLLICGV